MFIVVCMCLSATRPPPCRVCKACSILTLACACIARCRGQRTWRSTWSGRPRCTQHSSTRPCCTTWKWAAGRTPRHRYAVLVCSCSTDLPMWALRDFAAAVHSHLDCPVASVQRWAGRQLSRLASSDATHAHGRAWSRLSSRSYSSCWMSHTPERSPSCSRTSRPWGSSQKRCCPTGECRVSKASSMFAGSAPFYADMLDHK